MDALLLLAILLGIGYTAGTILERIHYRKIRMRERASQRFPVLCTRDTSTLHNIKDAFLVTGSVVVSVDYFKRFLAHLRNIFGGNVVSYESLLDRGRREAILRMKELARKRGAHIIVNSRLETASISGTQKNQNKPKGISILAYGTAIKLTRPMT